MTNGKLMVHTSHIQRCSVMSETRESDVGFAIDVVVILWIDVWLTGGQQLECMDLVSFFTLLFNYKNNLEGETRQQTGGLMQSWLVAY